MTNGEYIEKIIEQDEDYCILKDDEAGIVTVEVSLKWWNESQVEDAIKYFDIIYKLSQTYGVTYGFVENAIEEAMIAFKKLSKEPCDDAVSRQAVLDALDKGKYSNAFCKEHHIDQSINLGMVHLIVNELKPVTPQPKMGKWLKKEIHDGSIVNVRNICSNCGITNASVYKNYCPNCGSNMRRVDE